MSPGVYTETWRVWIDYNHDGDFTDAKEKIADQTSCETFSRGEVEDYTVNM